MKSVKTIKISSQNLTYRIINPKPLTKGFAPIENWLLERPEVSFGAKSTYARLVQFADKDGVAWPSQETLAKALGIKPRQLRTYIQELVRLSLIAVCLEGIPASNTYYFLYHPWMGETAQQDGQSSAQQDGQSSAQQDRQSSAQQDGQSSAQQDRQSSAQQDRQSSAYQDRQSSAPNKNKEKIIEKNKEKNTHTRGKESVCVSSSKVFLSPSEYSKEQWDKYAKAQKGVHNPEGLADSLSRSKENDYLMKRFLESQDKDKTAQSLKLKQDTQRQLKVAQDMESILASTLASLEANEPLLPWQIQLLEFKGYSFPHQQVS